MKHSETDSGGREAVPGWNDVLEPLSHSQWQVGLVVTGGGSGAITACFRRPGASKNFVEAVVPYSNEALVNYLAGPPPAGSASLQTAIEMAAVAFERAGKFGTGQRQHAAGIALVAALPTTPLRRGADRIHVSLQTARGNQTWSTELVKGQHTRAAAEDVADSMLLAALASLVEMAVGEE